MNSDVNVKMNEDNQHLLFEIQTQMQRKVELQNNLAVLNQQHRAAEGMSSRNLMLENEWNTLHQRLLLLQQEWHNQKDHKSHEYSKEHDTKHVVSDDQVLLLSSEINQLERERDRLNYMLTDYEVATSNPIH